MENGMMGFRSPTSDRARTGTQGETDGHPHLGSLSSLTMSLADGHTKFIAGGSHSHAVR